MPVLALFLALSAFSARAQTPANVLVVVNGTDALSRRIGDYYVRRRGIPAANVCSIKTPVTEEIEHDTYVSDIERPISRFLKTGDNRNRILFIVLMPNVPLKVRGEGSRVMTEAASVDSELTLLYGKMAGRTFGRAGPVKNPFFAQRDRPFSHTYFPIYLVTRLAGYDYDDIKGLIDRSLAARNRGKFVLDLKSKENVEGNNWLRTAATLLPADRVFLEESERVVYDRKDVIGYASWGSNDNTRKSAGDRTTRFHWLPGAIMTEFVSTDGRTFAKPPDGWTIGSWTQKEHFFAGTPQSLTADYLHEGVTGASGHVYEPFLAFTPRPDYVLPAYYSGRTLAESYYLGMQGLSWMNIVVGDPLCRIGKP